MDILLIIVFNSTTILLYVLSYPTFILCFRVLKKKLYVEELAANWPGSDKFWDWDMWMRTDGVRKGINYMLDTVYSCNIFVLNLSGQR